MKKIDSKAYKKLFLSLVIVIASFVLIFLGIYIYKSITERNVSYEKLESMMLNAAKRYFDSEGLPDVDGQTKEVSIPNLVSSGYLKSLDKLTNDTTCSGYVKVNNNGGYNLFIPYLKCKDYKTKTLSDAIKSNITTSGAGLYEINNEYVFKGEFVSNYVKFANSIWRIIKIDKDNNIRLIRTKRLENNEPWDDRYNTSKNANVGINIYNVSRIKEKLNSVYNNPKIFTENDKKHIVSSNVCVGKRSLNNPSLNNTDLCSEVVENQFLSLVDITEYYNASLDSDCKSLNDLSCQNYNYFTDFYVSGWTTTAVLENTYEVYKTILGEPCKNNAYEQNYFYIVLHVSGNEKHLSGSGTSEDPFIIEE
ncbi:MAG TPA: hypothetical protein GX747_03910 [Tenericutes bacterium]|nr:hypothetical protein [Mycoplasmatota bacterium]